MLWYVMVDEKTNHVSNGIIWGQVGGRNLASEYQVQDMKPRMFTPSMMATVSK